jgi:tetratricopeptide (TPR) repeat protein
MSPETAIKIVSKKPAEFSSIITVNDHSYTVLTENLGEKRCEIVSLIYCKGEIVFSKKSDYSHLTRVKNSGFRLHDLMERQHSTTINVFTQLKTEKQKSKKDFFHIARSFMKSGNKSVAFETIQNGLQLYPRDPFLMSYYGYLMADVEHNPDKGIQICNEAISQLKKAVPFGREFYDSMLYLNLGKACLKKNKAEAIKNFRAGLHSDPDNKELIRELDRLGTRRRPVIPFLDRDNPINKYFGMAISIVRP